MPLRALATVLVALPVAVLGCRATPVEECSWPADRQTSAATLLDDVRFAEDVAIRFADGKGYQPGWSATRKSCEAILFLQLASALGLPAEAVAAARAQLEQRGFDWVVNLPIAALCLTAGWLMARRLKRRFADERLPMIAGLLLGSVALAIAVIAVGQVWAAAVEIMRIGDGHLSYRAARIPWAHHRAETFILVVSTVWVCALLQRALTPVPAPGTSTQHPAPSHRHH